jgi:hypothetical protein
MQLQRGALPMAALGEVAALGSLLVQLFVQVSIGTFDALSSLRVLKAYHVHCEQEL